MTEKAKNYWKGGNSIAFEMATRRGPESNPLLVMAFTVLSIFKLPTVSPFSLFLFF